MIRFDDAEKRPPQESIIPMINVVFLLLIFFLMTAQIAPPAPFEVEPPLSSSETPAEGPMTLHIDAQGLLGYQDITGEDSVLARLRSELQTACDGAPCPQAPELLLRADRALDGDLLAKLMPKLAEVGFDKAQIVTGQ